MKKIAVVLSLASLIFVSSCGGAKKENNTPSEQQATEEYQCPMKCEEKTYSKPGKCPVCEMDLEKISKG